MTVPLPSDELLARHDVPGPRYTSYPTVPNWSADFGPDDYARRLSLAARSSDPLGLYVHLPYCRSLCWYCGCNVAISKSPDAIDDYVEALEEELSLVHARIGSHRPLAQLHWGGGTPTLLGNAQSVRLFSAIADRFPLAPGAEIAIEVHPMVTTSDQLRTLRRLGFNRISVGLQDLDPEVQRVTHRIQTEEQTRATIEEARALGFSGINVDLIYGLPKQTPETWRRTLDQVLAMRPDRLAVYSFAFVPDVLKHQRRLPAYALPLRTTKLGLFRDAWERFVGAGYLPIGMDHFAAPGDELARAQAQGTLARNFQGYTVRRASDLIGVGASAISEVGGAYAQSIRTIKSYKERIRSGRFATERGCEISSDDVPRRRIISDIMCHFHASLGPDPARYDDALARLEPLRADGLVEVSGDSLQVTDLGRPFVRNVAMAFDAYLGAPSTPRAGRFSRTV